MKYYQSQIDQLGAQRSDINPLKVGADSMLANFGTLTAVDDPSFALEAGTSTGPLGPTQIAEWDSL